MSGVAVIRYLLANNAPLVAVVPASKITAGTVPMNTALPAISLRQISGNDDRVISRAANSLITDRVQVTALTETYSEQKTILNLIRDALPGTYGDINGVLVDSLTQESTGPDLEYEEPKMYEQSVDYLIRYIR